MQEKILKAKLAADAKANAREQKEALQMKRQQKALELTQKVYAYQLPLHPMIAIVTIVLIFNFFQYFKLYSLSFLQFYWRRAFQLSVF